MRLLPADAQSEPNDGGLRRGPDRFDAAVRQRSWGVLFVERFVCGRRRPHIRDGQLLQSWFMRLLYRDPDRVAHAVSDALAFASSDDSTNTATIQYADAISNAITHVRALGLADCVALSRTDSAA